MLHKKRPVRGPRPVLSQHFPVRTLSYLLSAERAEDEFEIRATVLCDLAVVPLHRDSRVSTPPYRNHLAFGSLIVSVPYESDYLHHAHLVFPSLFP